MMLLGTSAAFAISIAMAREILSSDVLPSHYDLTLEPDLERFSFEGCVKISCDVHVATDTISVHAHELLISQATFRAEGGSATSAESIALKVKSKLAPRTTHFFNVLPSDLLEMT